ncbi:MAG: hypothetical protein KAQ83_03120 [Nanoarchaeota archaeon]|nr:hypothetical protein [Nanoarchaeota archaeon]
MFKKKTKLKGVSIEEFKKLFHTIDELLESLPGDKLHKFAHSTHFKIYKKIMHELNPTGVKEEIKEDDSIEHMIEVKLETFEITQKRLLKEFEENILSKIGTKSVNVNEGFEDSIVEKESIMKKGVLDIDSIKNSINKKLSKPKKNSGILDLSAIKASISQNLNQSMSSKKKEKKEDTSGDIDINSIKNSINKKLGLGPIKSNVNECAKNKTSSKKITAKNKSVKKVTKKKPIKKKKISKKKVAKKSVKKKVMKKVVKKNKATKKKDTTTDMAAIKKSIAYKLKGGK